jgi:hypothetical protein
MEEVFFFTFAYIYNSFCYFDMAVFCENITIIYVDLLLGEEY